MMHQALWWILGWSDALVMHQRCTLMHPDHQQKNRMRVWPVTAFYGLETSTRLVDGIYKWCSKLNLGGSEKWVSLANFFQNLWNVQQAQAGSEIQSVCYATWCPHSVCKYDAQNESKRISRPRTPYRWLQKGPCVVVLGEEEEEMYIMVQGEGVASSNTIQQPPINTIATTSQNWAGDAFNWYFWQNKIKYM
jgi:hypothetical protein